MDSNDFEVVTNNSLLFIVKIDIFPGITPNVGLLFKWLVFRNNNWKHCLNGYWDSFCIVSVGVGLKNFMGTIWAAFSYIIILYD